MPRILSSATLTAYLSHASRLTQTLSCGAIARRHARGMQRIAVSSAKACGHCDGHARMQLRTQWQQAAAARIRSQYFDWSNTVGMPESCGKTCSTSIGRLVRIGTWPRPIAGKQSVEPKRRGRRGWQIAGWSCLPLYPAPFLLIHIFRSARLTRALSCGSFIELASQMVA